MNWKRYEYSHDSRTSNLRPSATIPPKGMTSSSAKVDLTPIKEMERDDRELIIDIARQMGTDEPGS